MADEARRRWDYDPDTGVLRWKIRTNSKTKIGAVAGTLHNAGYIMTSFAGKNQLAHRLVWLIVYGEWPHGTIDHINGVKDDNRIANLRCVSLRQNQQNQKRHREGHLPGTTYLGRLSNKPWMAQAQIDGKAKYLGCFASQQEAHEAYVRATGVKP